MPRALMIATAFALFPLSSLGNDISSDRSQFQGYLDTCVAEHGTIDALVAPCVSDQVAAQENHLVDLLIETEAALMPDQVEALQMAQATWEAYRDAICAYQASLKPRDAEPRELFCRLRLVNARIADVLENEDFAEFED